MMVKEDLRWVHPKELMMVKDMLACVAPQMLLVEILMQVLG